ncbi:MAG: sigma-70 family RNA polymerase sigma factor [Pirellulales bacterium]|nr:sigma-70 family RNA polymerase sigma factor [Pirellulales bacterium]
MNSSTPPKPCSNNGSGSSISSTLLQRVRAKRPEAWERLVDLYGPSVYGWCRRAGLGPADSADVVQEVFAAVARCVDDFRRDRAGDSFTAWLATIARNKIHDHYRRQKDRPRAAGGTVAQQQFLEMPDHESPDLIDNSELEQTDRMLSRRGLQLVRAEFENRTWEAFWRTTVDAHAPANVAEDLGMSVAAVYKAKSRVLRRLRQELDGLTGP